MGSFTLTATPHELDGSRWNPGGMYITPNAQILNAAGDVIFDKRESKYAADEDGTYTVTLPTPGDGVTPSAFGFSVRLGNSGQRINVPAQTDGSTHSLAEFIGTTSLPMVPADSVRLGVLEQLNGGTDLGTWGEDSTIPGPGTYALALAADATIDLPAADEFAAVFLWIFGSFTATVEGVALTGDEPVFAAFQYVKGSWRRPAGVTGGGSTDPDPELTPATPAFPLTYVDSSGTYSYTIPTTTGVDYKVAGITQSLGTKTPSGPGVVVVTPVAQAGYVLTASTAWSHNFSSTVPAGSTYPAESMADAPIYALDLDDASGTTNVAQTGSTGYGATASGVTFGVAGMAGFDSAVNLGGGNISIPGGVTNGLAAMSVMFVASINEVNGYGNLLFGFHDGTTPTSLQISTGRHARGSLNGSLTPQGSATIEDNVEHFFAMTYDGTTMKVYVDGVLDGSAAFSGTVPPGGYQIGYAGLGPAHMNGLRIFNTALSAARIAAIAATT